MEIIFPLFPIFVCHLCFLFFLSCKATSLVFQFIWKERDTLKSDYINSIFPRKGLQSLECPLPILELLGQGWWLGGGVQVQKRRGVFGSQNSNKEIYNVKGN
jgi:hypothetical protein